MYKNGHIIIHKNTPAHFKQQNFLWIYDSLSKISLKAPIHYTCESPRHEPIRVECGGVQAAKRVKVKILLGYIPN